MSPIKRRNDHLFLSPPQEKKHYSTGRTLSLIAKKNIPANFFKLKKITSSKNSKSAKVNRRSKNCISQQSDKSINKEKIVIINRLSSNFFQSINLSQNEYDEICRFYVANKGYLEKRGEAVHIKKESVNLPRTVIYIPDDPFKGLHISTKKEVGIGAFNRVVEMFHLETGEITVKRSGLLEHVTEREIDRNNDYAKADPERRYFETGYPVYHLGSWRPRNQDRWRVPQEKSIQKVTMVMNKLSGGDLFDKICFAPNHPSSRMSRLERMKVICHFNRAVIESHRIGLVDLDCKPENILLDEDGNPKVGDFGLVYKAGVSLTKAVGSPGYISPEMIELLRTKRPLIVEPANQMWIQGCIMANTLVGSQFHYWTGQMDGYWGAVCNKYGLKAVIANIFPKYQSEGTVDWCIARCLEFFPEDRISAEELQPYLDKLYHGMRSNTEPSTI